MPFAPPAMATICTGVVLIPIGAAASGVRITLLRSVLAIGTASAGLAAVGGRAAPHPATMKAAVSAQATTNIRRPGVLMSSTDGGGDRQLVSSKRRQTRIQSGQHEQGEYGRSHKSAHHDRRKWLQHLRPPNISKQRSRQKQGCPRHSREPDRAGP